MRSVMGKLHLDQTFEEREHINAQIVKAADKASDPWGIKVTRYEIKDITPPHKALKMRWKNKCEQSEKTSFDCAI
jgi:regulator of protease activity HflC (stomatin/prohibitin superfamily)